MGELQGFKGSQPFWAQLDLPDDFRIAKPLSSNHRLREILKSLHPGHQRVIAFHNPENSVGHLSLKLLHEMLFRFPILGWDEP